MDQAIRSESPGNHDTLLGTYFSQLRQRSPFLWRGRVVEATGQTIESEGPPCSVGECCEIRDSMGRTHPAEVSGFRGSGVLSMTLDGADGIRYGDPVSALGVSPRVDVGAGLIGRVMDGMGQAIDGGRRPVLDTAVSLERRAPAPLEREPIREVLGTGIRAIDGMLSVGLGQRIGMMTRDSDADVIVVGLVGERGREVG